MSIRAVSVKRKNSGIPHKKKKERVGFPHQIQCEFDVRDFPMSNSNTPFLHNTSHLYIVL